MINFIGVDQTCQNLLNYASLRIKMFKNVLVCSLRKLSKFVQKQYILRDRT